MSLEQASKELAAVLDKFRSERAQLDGHITQLESLLASLRGLAPVKRGPGRPKGSGKKVGRPPKAVAAEKPRRGRKPKAESGSKSDAESAEERKRPNWSEDARKQAAERARKMWAERRKGKG